MTAVTDLPGAKTPGQRQDEAKRKRRREKAKALRKPRWVGPTERIRLMLHGDFALETFLEHDNDNRPRRT